MKRERQDEMRQNEPFGRSPRRRENMSEGGTGTVVSSGDEVSLEQNAAPAPALLLDPRLTRLTETARGYARAARSDNTALASSAQIEEAHVQKHLGHASAEMTRRYQRKRDRFRVNLTKSAGL